MNTLQVTLIVIGCVFCFVGFIMWFKGIGTDGVHAFKMFGFEFKVVGFSIVVFVIGSILVISSTKVPTNRIEKPVNIDVAPKVQVIPTTQIIDEIPDVEGSVNLFPQPITYNEEKKLDTLGRYLKKNLNKKLLFIIPFTYNDDSTYIKSRKLRTTIVDFFKNNYSIDEHRLYFYDDQRKDNFDLIIRYLTIDKLPIEYRNSESGYKRVVVYPK